MTVIYRSRSIIHKTYLTDYFKVDGEIRDVYPQLFATDLVVRNGKIIIKGHLSYQIIYCCTTTARPSLFTEETSFQTCLFCPNGSMITPGEVHLLRAVSTWLAKGPGRYQVDTQLVFQLEPYWEEVPAAGPQAITLYLEERTPAIKVQRVYRQPILIPASQISVREVIGVRAQVMEFTARVSHRRLQLKGQLEIMVLYTGPSTGGRVVVEKVGAVTPFRAEIALIGYETGMLPLVFPVVEFTSGRVTGARRIATTVIVGITAQGITRARVGFLPGESVPRDAASPAVEENVLIKIETVACSLPLPISGVHGRGPDVLGVGGRGVIEGIVVEEKLIIVKGAAQLNFCYREGSDSVTPCFGNADVPFEFRVELPEAVSGMRVEGRFLSFYLKFPLVPFKSGQPEVTALADLLVRVIRDREV